MNLILQAGHIEDVSLDEKYRGRSLGLKLVAALKEIGLVNDCYKIMLDCNDKNLGFYEKVRIWLNKIRMGSKNWKIVQHGIDAQKSYELS